MKKSKIIIIITALVLIALIVGVIIYIKIHSNSDEITRDPTELNIQYTESELSGSYENYTAKILLSNEEITIEGQGVSVSENEIKITTEGCYYITGNSEDANIVIEANKNDNVQLVLDNCNLTSKTTAPINGIKCNVLTITLAENSNNTISDIGTYTKFTDTEKSEPDGTIFTKTDLVINGTGSLTVNSNYLDGIVSKDTLKIINANININSKDDGIRGKDYVAIKSANITINAGGDGIKSTNEAIGYIVIQGGNLNITAVNDGIQAETILNISEDPQINITTTASQNKNNNRRNPRNTNSSSSVSSKGLKADKEITIQNGTITISSTDDSIHSNGFIIINGGEFSLSTGDDGIHADTNIIINNGNIDITKSYEGIESGYIEINEGTINIVASDDGINVASKNDQSSMENGPGMNNQNKANANRKLIINGGNITVNASGDGLDSNGSIYIYGGNILVKGPTSNGDAPLDFDGEMVIDGGNLISYGSSGMFESPSNSSKQNIIICSLNGSSGDKITVKDSQENEIASFEAEKKYQIIVISNDNIKQGETYKIYVNDTQQAELEVNSNITSNYTRNNNRR